MPSVIMNGRAFQLVTNTGILRVGDATAIYEDPITRKKHEGDAVVRECFPSRDDDFIEARVEFVDEPGEFYRRRIYRK